MTLLESLNKRLNEVRKTLEYADKRLKVLPDGFLKTRIDRGQVRYYQRQSKSDTNGRYLGAKDKDTIRLLEEKNYCQSLKCTAEAEERLLSEFRDSLMQQSGFETVFFNIPEEKKHLIQPYEIDFNAMVEKEISWWEKNMYSGNPMNIKNAYITNKGEKVRSKSELIIANQLKDAGVPYHYERSLPITVDSAAGDVLTWYPDFKVLNVRTGKEFYWEHFGMMDDAQYCASAQTRLEVYAKNGILQGKNLIVTMESTKHPLSTAYIDILIKEFLK